MVYPTFHKHSADSLFEGVIKLDSLASQSINVCYLLDVSGSMYLGHDLVRKHLVDHLINRADIENVRRIHFVEQNHHLNHNNNNSAKKPKAFRASKFNVIAFSDVLFPWSDEGVHLTRESVMVCAQWVKQNLKVKSGPSYFLPSLMFALKDSQIDEVVLITDSLPADRNLPDTLARITVAAKGRPVHTILVQTPPDPNDETRKLTNQDAECESFLRKLTQATGSVLRKVKIDASGKFFDDVTLVRESRYDQKRTESGRNFVENGVGDNLDGTTFLMTESTGCHVCPSMSNCAHIPTWRTMKKRHLQMPDVPSEGAASLLIGREVLARRNADGFHYLGTVAERSLNISRFYVEFPDPKSEQPQIEEISLKDIVNFEDGIRNPVREGDRVLASVGGSRKGKFVAGTVIEGEDMRNSFDCQNDSELAVAFCTGESKDVSSNFVVKIPQSMFDLLSLENGASPNERRSLQLARDQMEVERKAKEPICEGYTIKPDSCHGVSCCHGYIPVCTGAKYYTKYPVSVPSTCMSHQIASDSQDIVLTSVKDSFVHAKDLNLNPPMMEPNNERYPQPFNRESKDGWSLYQPRDPKDDPCCCHAEGEGNHCCMHCDSHTVHDLIDSDDEYDDLLGDISKWGDKKDAATSTDINLICPPFVAVEKRPPWRYWKRKKYEASPRSQPSYYAETVEYPATREISIQDTSGITGRKSVNYIPNDEHLNEQNDSNADQQQQAYDQNGFYSSSFYAPYPYYYREEEYSCREDRSYYPPLPRPQPKLDYGKYLTADERLSVLARSLNLDAQEKVMKRNNRVDFKLEEPKQNNYESQQREQMRKMTQITQPSEQESRANHTRDHWSYETNKYFDEVKRNLGKQKQLRGVQGNHVRTHIENQTIHDLENLDKFS